MAIRITAKKRTYCIGWRANAPAHVSVIEPGTVFHSGQPFTEVNESAVKFLEATRRKGIQTEPVPERGQPVEANRIYQNGDELVIARTDHERTRERPDQEEANFITYRSRELVAERS